MADEDSRVKKFFKKTDSSVSGEEGTSDPLRVAAEAGVLLLVLIEDKVI